MCKSNTFVLSLLLLFVFGSSVAAEAQEKDSDKKLAKPSSEVIASRVAKAKERLQQNKAGKLVWQSIEAHGGLEIWYSNGPLYLRYNYEPLGERQTRDTYQTIDTWSARARHQMASDREKEYGWTGQKPWQKPVDWQAPHHVAFWSLTPYYFVAMPFVLSDPGVNLEYKGTSKLGDESFHLIYVTFESDTGQSPDDYYYIYLDKETKQLEALRYVVAYDQFFPDGGHSPEKLLIYEGKQTVGDILFSTSHEYFKWDPDQKIDAEKVTHATVKNVEFRPETPDSYFDIPLDGEVWEPKKK